MENSFKNALTVSDLSLAYGTFQVLDRVDFDVLRGSCTIIMGGSGCGKSTLLKALIGLLKPKRGKIKLEGEDLWNVSDLQRQNLLRRCGVLFQGGCFVEFLEYFRKLIAPTSNSYKP